MGNWGDLEKRKKEKALGIWARDSESLFSSRGGGTIDVTCQDWLIDADGNKVREITSDVDRYLSAGKSSKKYPVLERTVSFDEGDVVSGENWGSNTSVGAYHDGYVYVSSSDAVTLESGDVTVYRYFYPVLDVNASIDGTKAGNTGNIARFNVYVDNKLEAENVTDFYAGVPIGSDYRIELTEYINWSYEYVHSYTDEGTVGKHKREEQLHFETRSGSAYVTIEDWVVDTNNNRITEITDKVDAFLAADKSRQKYTLQPRIIKADAGDVIDPSLFGNDESPRSYEDAYIYSGASEKVTVEGSGTTIYRYFYPVLDVNALLDGENQKGNTIDIATFNVYVDGRLKGFNKEDFYDGVPCGSEWEIRRINVLEGYELVTDEYLGVMGEEADAVDLEFNTVQQ